MGQNNLKQTIYYLFRFILQLISLSLQPTDQILTSKF